MDTRVGRGKGPFGCINGGMVRAAELSEVRRGTQWIFQDVALNTFAHYITKSVEFTGSVEGGQFIVEAEIEAIFGTAIGAVPEGAVCEVKTILPRSLHLNQRRQQACCR